MTPTRVVAVSTSILAAVAVLVVLSLGRVVLAPLAIAVLLAIVLRPAIAWLERHHVPAPAGSAVLILLGLSAFAAGGYFLGAPLREFGRQVPMAVAAGLERVDAFRQSITTQRPVDSAVRAQETGAQADSAAADSAAAARQASLPPLAPIATRVFGTTWEIVVGALEAVLLLFFMLAGGSKWKGRLLAAAPTASARRSVIELAEEIRAAIGRYLVTAAAINAAQGVLIGVVTAAIGIPGAALWGALTFFAEFVPYAGSATMIVLLTLVGLTMSGGWAHALLAPACYLAMAVLQANVVSPIVYGRGLNINPLAILLAVLLWGYLWGVAGAFLAVPMLAAAKLICERTSGLEDVAALLEG